MSDALGHEETGDVIPHQDEVESVIADSIVDASTQGVIANADAAVGSTPTKAEFDAVVTKLNQVLGVLRDMQAIPTS